MKPSPRDVALREQFESWHARYHLPAFRGTDPVDAVHRFDDPADQEVVALMAAAFASGNIKSIQSVLAAMLSRMGKSPAAFLRDAPPGELRGRFDGVYHRWVRESDIEVFLALIGASLRRHGSLGGLWQSLDDPAAPNVLTTLQAFTESVLAGDVAPLASRERTLVRAGREVPLARVESILLTSPAKGSACKRMHLFLRWMVRPADGIDLGLWSAHVSAARLVMPVDTHVLRICRGLRLTRAKTANRAAAESITARFRRINPADPCKYDFALVRAGIAERRAG